MPLVMIDGVEYIPKACVPELTDERLKGCLEVLTEMRYFKQNHKMSGLAFNAICSIAPEVAKLTIKEAYELIHGVDADA